MLQTNPASLLSTIQYIEGFYAPRMLGHERWVLFLFTLICIKIFFY
jgi:hypothetical protein